LGVWRNHWALKGFRELGVGKKTNSRVGTKKKCGNEFGKVCLTENHGERVLVQNDRLGTCLPRKESPREGRIEGFLDLGREVVEKNDSFVGGRPFSCMEKRTMPVPGDDRFRMGGGQTLRHQGGEESMIDAVMVSRRWGRGRIEVPNGSHTVLYGEKKKVNGVGGIFFGKLRWGGGGSWFGGGCTVGLLKFVGG